MKNISETVFNIIEEEVFSEELENAELPNPVEHLYTNEQNLNLNISEIIDLRSPIFRSNVIHLNNNEREESSEDDSSDEEGDEYDVSEIITSRLEQMQV